MSLPRFTIRCWFNGHVWYQTGMSWLSARSRLRAELDSHYRLTHLGNGTHECWIGNYMVAKIVEEGR